MVVDVVMPKMGESIMEGTILEWYKKVGDSIEKDETLLEIGTDKVDSEIPSPASGTISEILANPNDIVEKILNRKLEANTEVKTLTQKISFDHFCLNKRIFPVLRSDDDHLWGQVIAPF